MKIETKIVLRRVMIDFEPAGDVKMNFHGSLHPLDGATTGSAPEIMVQSTIHRSDELAKGLFEMIDREFATGVSVAAEHADRMRMEKKK